MRRASIRGSFFMDVAFLGRNLVERGMLNKEGGVAVARYLSDVKGYKCAVYD